MSNHKKIAVNPHFDLGLIAWDDSYSGRFSQPPSYSEQFDLQWKISLIDERYGRAPGASVDEKFINDRIYEWTGDHPDKISHFHDATGGIRKLDRPIPLEAIRGKRCVDIGCGMGRWTRAMQKLGAAEVISLDASESAVRSTLRFNPQTFQCNVMTLHTEHPEWKEAFDFANFWGVAMCTHDPLQAFLNAAGTLRPGGSMFLMVYADGGLHDKSLTNLQRKLFHSLSTIEERLQFVEHVYQRKWDPRYPFLTNLEHLYANFRGFHKGTLVGVLDMLEPFYNWVIPWKTVLGWAEKGGFTEAQILNEHENPKCAYHVLFRKAD